MTQKTIALLALCTLLLLLPSVLLAQTAAAGGQTTSKPPEWKATDTLQHLDYALRSLREAKTALGQANEDKPEPGHKDKAMKATQEAIDQTAAAIAYWKAADAKWQQEQKSKAK
jgi:hypothetical protein